MYRFFFLIKEYISVLLFPKDLFIYVTFRNLI